MIEVATRRWVKKVGVGLHTYRSFPTEEIGVTSGERVVGYVETRYLEIGREAESVAAIVAVMGMSGAGVAAVWGAEGRVGDGDPTSVRSAVPPRPKQHPGGLRKPGGPANNEKKSIEYRGSNVDTASSPCPWTKIDQYLRYVAALLVTSVSMGAGVRRVNGLVRVVEVREQRWRWRWMRWKSRDCGVRWMRGGGGWEFRPTKKSLGLGSRICGGKQRMEKRGSNGGMQLEGCIFDSFLTARTLQRLRTPPIGTLNGYDG
ncbi:uncharacterized protein EV422DRAFT_603600 [Fimicolochytrium jonesii]|uniref:uncharacterized protein n=1 Tax=Fimicolochytrium jonesii TaxID=1396493 RepID=UPI0022FEFC91|nr:uncharacterized protein EV422DRAFT_603600 [Fimicolochytrium jonesii]KAI8817834.1 hypothetical protein EV422DRAFT_603600 [Fimicolochytrium jonesii]